MQLQQIKLLTIPLNLGGYNHFVESIMNFAKTRTSAYVCVANVHSCVESHKNSNFAKAIAQADMVAPDGMPLKLALDWLYHIKQERVAGPDLMPKLLKEAEKRQLSVFLYGSTPEILDKLKERFAKEYSGISIVGMISPPYRTLSESEQVGYQDIINASEANLVFVALGCPKQELWMASMRGRINAVMIGVGAAFPMLAGVEKRAPTWMQKSCLEWFYRLSKDPKRLFKRYFVTNTIFVYLLLKEKYSHVILRKTVSPNFFYK